MSEERIKDLFSQAMGFTIAGKADAARHTVNIEEAARDEATKHENITLTREGYTPGMKVACVTPFYETIERWRQVRDAWRTETVPLFEEIDKESSPAIKKRELEETTRADVAKLGEQALKDSKYADAKKEKEAAEDRFAGMVAAHDRQPKMFPIFLYLIILAGFGAVEWLVNFSTFRANWGIPALSAGFTILVGLVVAGASHVHGTFFKQREYWFGDHVDPTKKRWEFIFLVVASLAFIAVLVWVGFERHEWGMRELQKAGGVSGVSILSEKIGTGYRIDVTQKVTLSLIANSLVWILGMSFAYMVHDVDHDFPFAKRERDKTRKRFARLHVPVERKIKAREAELDRKVKELGNITAAAAKLHGGLRLQQTQLKTHEASLLKSVLNASRGLVEDYQHFFCSEALANDHGLKLNKSGKIISPSEYQHEKLSVGADEFRRIME